MKKKEKRAGIFITVKLEKDCVKEKMQERRIENRWKSIQGQLKKGKKKIKEYRRKKRDRGKLHTSNRTDSDDKKLQRDGKEEKVTEKGKEKKDGKEYKAQKM